MKLIFNIVFLILFATNSSFAQSKKEAKKNNQDCSLHFIDDEYPKSSKRELAVQFQFGKLSKTPVSSALIVSISSILAKKATMEAFNPSKFHA